MKRASIVGLLVLMALTVTGCRSTGPNITNQNSDYKTYADRKPMGEVLVIESDAMHAASFNASGSRISISTMVPPIEPPDSRKYAFYESATGKICNVLTFGLLGYFMRDMVGDAGGTTNVYNEAPATP